MSEGPPEDPKPRKRRRTQDEIMAEEEKEAKRQKDEWADYLKDEGKRRAVWAESADAARLAVQASREAASKYTPKPNAFYITFIQMGQGDCAIMTTPAGKIIMIDCGSDSMESGREPGDGNAVRKLAQYRKRIADAAQSKLHLIGKDKIDVLIITHPNTDHYNRLADVLFISLGEDGGRKTYNYYPIGTVYHSRAIDAYSGQKFTSQSGDKYYLDQWLGERTAPANIKSVVLYHDITKTTAPPDTKVTADAAEAEAKSGDDWEKDKAPDVALENRLAGTTYTEAAVATLAGVEIPAFSGTPTVGSLDADGGLVVHTEANCTVTLLAAGVDEDYRGDGSDLTNRGSVMTLIEVHGRRVLVSGDATVSTEHYIRKKRSDRTVNTRIQNLAILQAGHHGSPTSSHHQFVNYVNPRWTVISSGFKVEKDALPKGFVVTRHRDVLTKAGLTSPEHPLSMWVNTGVSTQRVLNTTAPLHTTGSKGSLSFEITTDGTVTFLNDTKAEG
ncbi:ComEC/Rec2 family competence protein [Herbidospora sp. RD11066]